MRVLWVTRVEVRVVLVARVASRMRRLLLEALYKVHAILPAAHLSPHLPSPSPAHL